MKATATILVLVGLLFAGGCATRPKDLAPVNAPLASNSAVKDLWVVSAVYGSGTHFADVTARVSELLYQPEVEFFARPEWVKADPTPGWNKALVIVYEFKGHRRIFTAGEDGKVSLKLMMKPKRIW